MKFVVFLVIYALSGILAQDLANAGISKQGRDYIEGFFDDTPMKQSATKPAPMKPQPRSRPHVKRQQMRPMTRGDEFDFGDVDNNVRALPRTKSVPKVTRSEKVGGTFDFDGDDFYTANKRGSARGFQTRQSRKIPTKRYGRENVRKGNRRHEDDDTQQQPERDESQPQQEENQEETPQDEENQSTASADNQTTGTATSDNADENSSANDANSANTGTGSDQNTQENTSTNNEENTNSQE
jgi:hypothetical protein